ncbi:MAG TPA: hypothetical protein PKN30_08265 [Flavobacteriales bacterium]|nr:hypothetical protein [Flavobacteriales bacterium]
MSNKFPRKSSLSAQIYEQTEAQWEADQRVFDVNVMLVPTDGDNQGKHKIADGIHRYSDLDFFDTGASGTGSISIGGEAWKVYGIEATSDEQGSVILDLEELLPGITHVKMASVANNSSTEAKIVLGRADPVSPLSAYAITVYDKEFNALADAPVLITLYVKGA